MTLHPETSEVTRPDRDSQPNESTAGTDQDSGARANARSELQSTALRPGGEPQPAGGAGASRGSVKADAESTPETSRERDSTFNQDVDGDAEPLLSTDARKELSSRWNEIQANFVDRPRGSVQEADALVVDVMQRVTGSLSNERERLESQWRQGDDVSTEDLRVALTRYRSFFDRLLTA